jgi:hypothetical protein
MQSQLTDYAITAQIFQCMFQIDYKPSELPVGLQPLSYTSVSSQTAARAHVCIFLRMKKRSSFTLVTISHMPVVTSVNSVSNFMRLFFIITEIISPVTEWEQNEKKENTFITET